MKKRKSLKKTLLTKIIIYVAIIIVIITQISIKLAADNIQSLTNNILARESVTYATEIYSWWNNIEERVSQTANVMRTTPDGCPMTPLCLQTGHGIREHLPIMVRFILPSPMWMHPQERHAWLVPPLSATMRF